MSNVTERPDAQSASKIKGPARGWAAWEEWAERVSCGSLARCPSSPIPPLGRTCFAAVLMAVAVLALRFLDGPSTATIALGFATYGFLLGGLLATSRSDAKVPPSENPLDAPAYPCHAPLVDLVKAALANLDDRAALLASPLTRLPGLTSRRADATALRALLVDAVSELATSPKARDCEAGRLLLDYYVKRVGTHEIVMERLYLSRPTFYRRLKHGLLLVARHIDELSADQTCRSPSGRSRRAGTLRRVMRFVRTWTGIIGFTQSGKRRSGGVAQPAYLGGQSA